MCIRCFLPTCTMLMKELLWLMKFNTSDLYEVPGDFRGGKFVDKSFGATMVRCMPQKKARALEGFSG